LWTLKYHPCHLTLGKAEAEESNIIQCTKQAKGRASVVFTWLKSESHHSEAVNKTELWAEDSVGKEEWTGTKAS